MRGRVEDERPRARRPDGPSSGSTSKRYGQHATAIRDAGDERRRVQPLRQHPRVGRPAVQVGVDPAADRPVERGREQPRRSRSHRPARRRCPGSSRRGRPRSGTRPPRSTARPATTPARTAQPPSARTSRGSAARGASRRRRNGRRPRSTAAARRPRRVVGPRRRRPRRPSGAQAIAETPQSPSVTWRGRAPGFASTTNRCCHRSRCPTSSYRQSIRSIRRATGSSPDFGSGADDEPRRVGVQGEREPLVRRAPTRSRRPTARAASGPPTALPGRPSASSGRTRRRAVSPSALLDRSLTSRSRAGARVRRKATERPSGATRGDESRTGPLVSWIGRRAARSRGTSHRCDR